MPRKRRNKKSSSGIVPVKEDGIIRRVYPTEKQHQRSAMSTLNRNQRRRQPVRTQQRRSPARVSQPPDYSRDYIYVKRDLLMISFWGGILFLGMVVASFVI